MDVDVFIKNLDMLMEELDGYLDENNLDDDWHCGYDAGVREAYKLIIICRDGFVGQQTQEKEVGGMTENEKEVLDYIRDRRNWRPPTWEAIVEAVELSGKKSLSGILRRLEEKGYLEKHGHYYYPKEWKNTFNIEGTKRKGDRG